MNDSQLIAWIGLALNFGLPLLLLALGLVVGNWMERRHYASILKREEELHSILLIASRRPPDSFDGQQLVQGSVVVSSDYFRRMLAGFRNIFGGSVRSYETLLDRGRREAILRMKEQAAAQGANAIFNVKIETAALSSGREGVAGTIEVLAVGTAGRL